MSLPINSPLVIGSDHAGFAYKEKVMAYLESKGYRLLDMGAYSEASADYPDYAHAVAEAIEQGRANMGILLCGSANGVAITANKHKGIRAAICWQTDIARLARLHNDANIICLPARFISVQNALDMTDIFLTTAFEGGRHAGRVRKISLEGLTD